MLIVLIPILAAAAIFAWSGARAASSLACLHCAAETHAARLEHELSQVRQRRYTHPTIDMLEDIEAVTSDLNLEMGHFVRYAAARLAKLDAILAAGRPGPYAYHPLPTHDRPPRPGQQIKLWTL